MQRRASPILWVHIPLLRRTNDFATAFQTFHQEIFTSSGLQQDGGHEGARGFVDVVTGPLRGV
jgi:hypothetical protein